jgi:cell envelope opacity-associated protein A
VQWKRGLYLRPVASLTIERKPLRLEEGDNQLLYVIKVRDHNIPLTDHLILSVVSANGKILSRMSARL